MKKECKMSKENITDIVKAMPVFETQFMELRSDQIVVDPTYQRKISDSEVKNILKNFSANVCNEPKVSYRDGKYYVFDGQHTIASLVARNGMKPLRIQCKVFFGMTQLDEAALFLKQTGESKILTPGDKLRTRYKMGDPEAIDMVNTLESIGYKVAFSGGKRTNHICCISQIEDSYHALPKTAFIKMMCLIKEVWHGDTESLNAKFIRGFTIFYKTFDGQINQKRLAKQIQKYSPQQILRESKMMSGQDVSVARFILCAYNSGRGGDKLENTL